MYGLNISKKASFIGFITDNKALNALDIELIAASLPPACFQAMRVSFRDFAMFEIIGLILSFTAVQRVFASLKFPITILNESDHPVPIASLVVSINCENVFTLVAAS